MCAPPRAAWTATAGPGGGPSPAADTGHPAPPAPDAPSDEDIGWPRRCAPPGP
ncbi:hypothetical protein [Streptomyces mirabilis]|uniref:hypothetical protein n=1 Tax=Streptomyces mirabilis TaxID=68239 RepID=UPI0033BEEB41